MKEETLSLPSESHFASIGDTRPKRPFSVTLLAIGVLTLAAAGFVRLGHAVTSWNDLINLSLSISPIYMVVTGLIFGLAGLPIGWGVWRGLSWAPRFTTGYIIFVLTYFWLNRIFFIRSETGLVNTPFAIGVTILILPGMSWVLFRKRAKRFFIS